LQLSVIDEHYCQFTSVTQALTRDAKLTFVNSSNDTISVQDVGKIGQVLVARSSAYAKNRLYELVLRPDYINPGVDRVSAEIVLKPGETFARAEKIGLMIAKPGAKPVLRDLLGVGDHYLQVQSGVAIGRANPLTWQNISLRSVPIGIAVKYVQDASPCQQSQPE
jgi:hypothetical protein